MQTADKQEDGPGFEAAMERLDQLVGEMETEKLPLQSLLEKYEEGVRLTKYCQQQLDAAEQKVRVIAESAAGDIRFADLSE